MKPTSGSFLLTEDTTKIATVGSFANVAAVLTSSHTNTRCPQENFKQDVIMIIEKLGIVRNADE